ncbi:MAG: peptidyl-prolyl cis-trans isomerase [Planctomycetota bacterium]
MIKRMVREPLVLLFLLGAVVFGIHAALRNDSDGGQQDRYVVEVTSADIEWLRNRWNKLMGREPTLHELRGLVESMIREEILYREAVAMGLDEKDTVVRRRLAQKMEFLFKDLAEAEQPSEEILREYFGANRERYIRPGTVSFGHVFFSRDKRGEKAESDARGAIEQLAGKGIEAAEAKEYGDPFVLAGYYERQSAEEVARTFGGEFAQGLFKIKTAEWGGPVRSSYGWHVVFVQQRTQDSVPDFEQVRAKVEVDYMAMRKAEMNNRAYGEISSKYTVMVEDMPYQL